MVQPKKLGIAGGAIFFLGIIIGWMAFPALLKSQVKGAVGLKQGSEMRELWSKFPFAIDFKVYLFNVTNPAEITEGKKPVFREIGPYFYDEYKEKVNLEDREADDSVEYNSKTTWFFNPSKSHGLTGDEIITFPNILILGMAITTLREKPTAMGLVGKAVDSIFKKPTSVFMQIKAKDMIFDGIPIDCRVSDFAGSAVCSLLKTNSKDLIEIEENYYKFSLFGSKNGTVLPDRTRVLRGLKNYKDVGRVIEYEGKESLSTWPEDHCNEFNGTDSTIFPPLMTQDDDIVSFSSELCRSLSAHFSHPTKVKGLKTLRYTAELGDMSTDPLLKCFCPTPDTCLSKQLYDLTKCLGAPITASLPHFHLADEKYLQMVDGLHPDKNKHEIEMDFEPMTATPLSAQKRLQFNMFVQPIEKFKLMKTFPEVLFPLFWIEEGLVLDDEFVNKVKSAFKMITVVNCLKWFMVLTGVGLGGAAAGLHFKNRDSSNKLDITKVTPQNGSRKDSSQEKKWPPAMNIATIQSAAVPATLDRN